MNALGKWVARGGLVVALPLSACGSSSAETEGATAAQFAASQQPAEVTHANFIREALAKVSLRPDQRPLVDRLGQEANARHDGIRAGRAALQSAFADQVLAG